MINTEYLKYQRCKCNSGKMYYDCCRSKDIVSQPERQAKENRESDSKPFTRSGRKIGRNDKCHCGSGKKFKNCHQKIEHETQEKMVLAYKSIKEENPQMTHKEITKVLYGYIEREYGEETEVK